MASSNNILSEHNVNDKGVPDSVKPDTVSDLPASGLTRRQLLAGIVGLSVELALPTHASAPVHVGNSEELTPAALAWQQIPESQRHTYYQNQEWRQWQDPANERRADCLRWELSKISLYPLVCHPLHPITQSKAAERELNQRAALHALIDELSGPDLWSLFDVARLYSRQPLEGERLETLADHQRRRLHPDCGGAA